MEITAEKYAEISCSPEALNDWQDRLDSLFNDRIVETRNALRDHGFVGDRDHEHGPPGYRTHTFRKNDKSSCLIAHSYEVVGAGRNVVSLAWKVTTDNAVEVATITDNLTLTPLQLAAAVSRISDAYDLGRCVGSTSMEGDLAAIARDLRDGAAADIWYDALHHGDQTAADRIERTQEAMAQAAGLITGAAGLKNLLVKAERFISGFEGDGTQDGIDDLLREIRAAAAHHDQHVGGQTMPSGQARTKAPGMGPAA